MQGRIALVEALSEAPFTNAHLPKNAKLTDQEVVLMRELRAHYGLEWELLAEMFQSNWKTCYRICTGKSRSGVEGPLEPSIDKASLIVSRRCSVCGQLYTGPMCVLCQCRWSAFIVRFLVQAGVLRHGEF